METNTTIDIDTVHSGSISNQPPGSVRDVEGPSYCDSIQGDSAYGSESLSGRELLNSVKPAELTPGEFYTCTILRTDSPTEFWVRLPDWGQNMAEISRRLGDRYRNTGSPGLFGWQEGDYCAVRYPRGKDWLRALITKVREELLEVLLIDQGISTTAPLRLAKPIPEQISKISWQSLQVKVATVVPRPQDFQWGEDVVSNLKQFIQFSDRVAIQVSAQSDKPYAWVGEVFFYLDQDSLHPPLVRTHRFRASTLLVRPPSPEDLD